MIFRRLKEEDNQAVMEYLMQEPEFNLFIIGDIENFGYNTDFQTIWGIVDNGNRVQGILLKYYSSFIPYAYDREILKRFAPLISLGARVVSGKQEIIDIIKPYLTKNIIEEKKDYFARLRELNRSIPLDKGLKIKRAGVKDVDRLLELRNQIAEFGSLPLNRESVIKKLKTGSGRVYYLEDNTGRMVSSAATSAENSLSAMIVGVATLPEYRKRGLATNCVYRICEDLLAEKKIPCLFYDNPEAGKIYRRIGFEEIGNWSIIQLD